MKLYDPRDPAQRMADPSTWKESDNPALILADLFNGPTHCWEIDWDSVALMAEYCDGQAA